MNNTNLVKKIKLKGVLKALPDQFVSKEIDEFSKRYSKASEKDIFKGVRKKLHETYGAFQTRRKKKRHLYLEELKIAKEENGDKIKNSEEMKQIRRRILKTNLSAAERLEADYAMIYTKVKGLLRGRIRSVMDLGCGMNPVSFCPNDFRNTEVFAYDIDKNDIDFLNKYFRVMEMKAKAKVLDIHDLAAVKRLPNVDAVLMFKVIDPLERRGHLFSEEILKILKNKTKNLVVSFATKTVTNKRMNHPERGWFEQMIKRLGFKGKIVRTKNEIYYVLHSA